MKTYNEIRALAAELDARLPKRESELGMNVCVWAEKDECCDTGEIHCAPANRGIFNSEGYIMYVEEIVLFAKYHDLSVHTCSYETGAGLRLS